MKRHKSARDEIKVAAEATAENRETLNGYYGRLTKGYEKIMDRS